MAVPLNEKGPCKWEIPKEEGKGMRVPGIIYANKELVRGIMSDQSLDQVVNVSRLPGIVGASIAMPDIHLGYGFPIGGVAAFDLEDGVISPGGVGYDINCGIRLIRTDLGEREARDHIKELINTVFENVPSGVGRIGKLKLNSGDLENLLDEGVDQVVRMGYGWAKDTERIEEGGSLKVADRSKVSQKARARGFPQLGSLGAGNHFLEVQVVDRIYDPEIASKFGLYSEGQVTVMVHTGSRGFGHQVATDYLEVMGSAMKKYDLSVPDRQLSSVPYRSREAQDYIGAMGSAANFGFSNRQIITHWIRESFKSVFKRDPEDMGMDIVYDVCHNIAKVEEHSIDGKERKVVVHRKGATRAFPAGRRELPQIYMNSGHPVLIPGTMGTSSYVLVGTNKALEETFGSTCHGSGRVMSRSRAVKEYSTEVISSNLERMGTYVRAATKYVLQEEAPLAYKDVDQVVRSVECAGISKIVARLRPIGVMKG
ncbi:MAG: RtcB family protein [Candidatus Thermoplasmatota archaeon]|nr:RtcB family protein [Candidatus Thermoplasmatota archaeon]MCL5789494.1 RtcB family protein [Candidatus Thermoplasmatota archaeon]